MPHREPMINEGTSCHEKRKGEDRGEKDRNLTLNLSESSLNIYLVATSSLIYINISGLTANKEVLKHYKTSCMKTIHSS